VALFMVLAFVCMVAFVAHTVREDRRAGGPVRPSWRGWLLLAGAPVCVLCGVVLFVQRLFSG
jgi:hypothetical protein